MKPARCRHKAFSLKCSACRALQRKWYDRLKATGFNDIEYGRDNPRFVVNTPDPTQPGTEQAQHYYDLVWQIFHQWVSYGRSPRDCRVAELFAEQSPETGTVRGISRTLKQENLSPHSADRVQVTLKEIYALVSRELQGIVFTPDQHAVA